MNHDLSANRRVGAITLFCSVAPAIFLMVLHPTSAHHHLNEFVHAGMIISIIGMMLGLNEFSLALGLRHVFVRWANLLFRLGVVAAVGAALIDGFIVADLSNAVHSKNPEDIDEHTTRLMFQLCWFTNQSLANFMTFAISAAMILWSTVLVHRCPIGKTVGVSGFLTGGIIFVTLAAGHLTLNVHGMLLAVIGIGIWVAGAAFWMLMSERCGDNPTVLDR